MPWSNNSGNPWGGGSSGGDNGGGGKNPWGTPPPGGGGGGGGGGQGPQPPNLDELFRQSQERLKRTFGGDGGGGGISKAGIGFIALLALAAWVIASVFQLEQSEKAVVLTFGEYSDTRGPGLNFAFWPIQTHQTIVTTTDRTLGIGISNVSANRRNLGRDTGLMLTGDENVVDVEFEIAWDISDPRNYLFELAAPQETIEAVSEASIREVIGKSKIDPVLQRDAALTSQVETLIQSTLDGYDSGVNIVRVNFVGVSPPSPVIESFDNVTKATQKNQQLKLDADGYRFQKLADARGEAARIKEEADAYALRVENGAAGEAERFKSVYDEYKKAPEVTRKRLYLETMERVFGDINKIILDENIGGSGVVPYLPLNELGNRGGGRQ